MAGIRTPKHIDELKEDMPEIYAQFVEVADKLERHYRDMQDLEFTVERGKLWMLQTRNGKRTGPAAVRIAVEMVREGMIDEKTAILRIPAGDLDQLLHKMIDPKAKMNVLTKGINASPGAAAGKVVFHSQGSGGIESKRRKGHSGRRETSPEDVRGMDAAVGHSHLNRRAHKPCRRGGARLGQTLHRRRRRRCHQLRQEGIHCNGTHVRRGDWITVDGTSGHVILGQAPLIDPELGDDFHQLMEWADKLPANERAHQCRYSGTMPR